LLVMADQTQAEDPFYELGTAFLGLPARATRDGSAEGDVVGTCVHLEVYGIANGAPADMRPPYLSVAFEPATGHVIDVRAIDKVSAYDVYDDALWGFIQSYLGRGGCGDAIGQPAVQPAASPAPAHRPATLTSTDVALADYIFGGACYSLHLLVYNIPPPLA